MTHAFVALAAGSLLTVAAQAQPAPTKPVPDVAKPALASNPAEQEKARKPYWALVEQSHAALDRLGAGGDLAGTTATINGLWDWACGNLPAGQSEVFLELGVSKRMVDAAAVYQGNRAELVRFLRASPRLSKALLYQVAGGEGDRLESVMGVLDQLRKAYKPEQLEGLANLTAAICVVYDRPVIKRINENEATGLEPVTAFKYFSEFGGRMAFSPARMPTELLVFMVDAAATLDEYAWAAQKYGGRREIGPLYSEIVYDFDHFNNGTQKRVTKEGFTLPNIKKYGGICADQAHFASTVGKVVGVPAVVASGQGSGVGHAWLGYLKPRGGGAEWDFKTGRYTEYELVRGSVTDPQTGAEMPDGTLALTAEAMDFPDAARQASTALSDAAARLGRPGLGGAGVNIELSDPALGRKGTPAERLDLLKAAVNLYPANHRAWNVLRAMASAGQLSLEQKKEWAEAVQRLCGNKYPDFTLAVLIPMVSTIDDVGQQGAIWETLFTKLRATRPDLAAEVLIAQGKMWDKADQPAKAMDSFVMAAKRFIQQSQASIDALEECERMMVNRKVGGAALDLYADMWRRVGKPDNMAQEFLRQSNWYKVGSRYVELLEAAGNMQKANSVRRALGEDQASIDRRSRQTDRQERRER